MPFVRISLARGKPRTYLKALADQVHAAMVESFNVPEDDRFQVIHQHDPDDVIFDAHYMGMNRSADLVYISITAGRMRSTETKRAFYRTLSRRLGQAPGIRPDDVMVMITTTQGDEWSFGNGAAQLVEAAS